MAFEPAAADRGEMRELMDLMLDQYCDGDPSRFVKEYAYDEEDFAAAHTIIENGNGDYEDVYDLLDDPDAAQDVFSACLDQGYVNWGSQRFYVTDAALDEFGLERRPLPDDLGPGETPRHRCDHPDDNQIIETDDDGTYKGRECVPCGSRWVPHQPSDKPPL